MAFEALRGWTPTQKHAAIATYMAWTLDAFDYFLLVFVLTDVASEFHAGIPAVALAVTLTLAFRPVGAFIFGRLADRHGRRPILMLNIALYSIFGFATAFAPSLPLFLIIRSLFGIAMGGVWGIGASLAMETIPPKARGFVSGLLQSGYPTGYLFASLVFGFLYSMIGWRGMFVIGIVPALILILYIYRTVPESPGWSSDHKESTTFAILRSHWRVAVYAIALMTAFNFFSHGTQDLYPAFLEKQRGLDHATISAIAVIYNIGAIAGGLFFGSFSQVLGRRRTAIIAALLAIPVTFLWAYASTAIMLGAGAFVMQIFVQGAWGIVPAHLNELSPPQARSTFPGTIYQLGNFIASINAVLQATLAEKDGGNYSFALAAVAVAAALAIAVLMKLGPEAKNVEMRA